MVEVLREKFPGLRVWEDSVEEAPRRLREHGFSSADVIVSGLPWAAFDHDTQDRLLRATLEVLADGGTFTTFAYLQGLLLPAGRRFARRLASSFSQVARTSVVWRNLPPAFVYRCVK
jgi:phospholipid N-methyltransferase